MTVSFSRIIVLSVHEKMARVRRDVLKYFELVCPCARETVAIHMVE